MCAFFFLSHSVLYYIHYIITLKSNSQCVTVANLANRTLGMINRTIIVNKDTKTLLKLCQLEYCVYKHGCHTYRRI